MDFPAAWRKAGRAASAVTLAILLCGPLAFPSVAGAQNQKNNKNKKEPETTGIVSPIPLPDSQAIDLVVSQMLGAWQIGDIEMMHKSYADDVMVVSGAWEQPIIGWDNYARAYQLQRSRTQGGRLDRSNTYTKVQGDMAWCTYQWEFHGQVDGNPATAVGHTTLVLEKRAGNWIIAVNHTSVVPTPGQAVPTPVAAPQASQPAKK
jgi:uncharacterized protein (TIGR02246 family)